VTERFASGQWQPEIIICDYDLHARETGIDLLNRLVPGMSSPVTCVLMTADTTSQVVQAAEAAGYPVIYKPVRPAKLRSLLSYAVKSNVPEAAVTSSAADA
jgi:CheY-like chemotaxis protein